MPSVRLLTDMMPAPSSQSSGSISLARRPPRSTSEYLNFFVDDLSSWDGNGAPDLARRHAADPVFGVGHIGGIGLVDFALLDARILDG